MKKLVVFDLDGTLLYSLEDLHNSLNFALSRYGYATRTLQQVNAAVGNGVGMLVRRSLPDTVSAAEFENCYNVFKEHYAAHCCEKTRPYDGVIDVLKTLRDKGIKVGVLSNKFHSAAVEVVEHYFHGLYDIVLGESDRIARKPNPDGVLAMLREMNVDKADAILFGDSDVDLVTAGNAGVDGVAVLWGFRDRQFLVSAGAKYMIEKPSEVLLFV
ncbi:MAG: HAD family hydrolase [Candidatus Limimorpha sp.]